MKFMAALGLLDVEAVKGHAAARLLLTGFGFCGRQLELVHALPAAALAFPVGRDDEIYGGTVAALVPLHGAARLPPRIAASLGMTFVQKCHCLMADHAVLHFADEGKAECLLYVGNGARRSRWDFGLLRMFSLNVSMAHTNPYMSRQMLALQLEVIARYAREDEPGAQAEKWFEADPVP
jgi:hypothetical protein